jgi:hypothetical protein
MPNRMVYSERFLAGFTLAATVAKDRGAVLAREGLADAVADAMTATARELTELSKADRRARVRALAEPPAHRLPRDAASCPRAYALLARKQRPVEVPDWLRATPLPRPGFTPEPQLQALLARIAARLTAAEAQDPRWPA